MPFSQQSYAGQGIVQMDPRAGEFIGASLANMGASIGQSIGQGLQQRGQRNEEAKRKAGASKGMREAMVNLGLLEKDQANSMGFDELLSFSQNAPSLLAKQKEEQFGEVLSSYQQAKQPQSVSEQVDFGPQIERAESELGQAIQRNRFIPEIAYQTQAEQPVQPDVNQFYGQAGPGVADRLAELPAGIAKSLQQRDTPNVSIGLFPGQAAAPSPRTQRSDVSQMRDEMRAMRQSQSSRPAQASTPSPQSKPEQAKPSGPIGPEQMPPEPEEVTSLRDQLSSLQAKASEGATASRPETPEEAAKRLGDFWSNAFKKSPGAAVELHKMLTKDKLTPSERLSYSKYQDELEARTIPGFDKPAPSTETAKELRSLDMAYNQVDSGVNRLLEILDTPNRSLNFDLRSEANTIVGLLTGALRVPITGPGAFSDSERKMIEGIIANPARFWSVDSRTRKSLETLRERIKSDRDGYAKSIGISPTNQQSKAAPRVTTRDKFGNIVTQ
jgi:hypothetical protein